MINGYLTTIMIAMVPPLWHKLMTPKVLAWERDYATDEERDTLSAEFHRTPFTETFIYGFYQGQMVFVEPMVTLDFLASHPDVSSSVKQAEVYQTPGSYPASYRVRYDASQHATYIELDSLAIH